MTRRKTGPTPVVAAIVKEQRAQGLCERCGLRCGEQLHHRLPRRMGGTRRSEVNRPPNLVFTCLSCHQDIENHRLAAIGDGWLVQDRFVPAEVRIRLHYGWHLLTDDGHAVPVPGPCRVGCAEWTTDKDCDCAKEA